MPWLTARLWPCRAKMRYAGRVQKGAMEPRVIEMI